MRCLPADSTSRRLLISSTAGSQQYNFRSMGNANRMSMSPVSGLWTQAVERWTARLNGGDWGAPLFARSLAAASALATRPGHQRTTGACDGRATGLRVGAGTGRGGGSEFL